MLLLACAAAVPEAIAGCPTDEHSRAELKALVASNSVAPPAPRLVDTLADCLADPDPEVRDRTAYSLLARYIGNDALDAGALRRLRDAMYTMLRGEDPQGFGRPFAALVMARIVERDLASGWMTASERDEMVRVATRYVASIDDYRGFDAAEGWRHGVAHAADWLAALARHPDLSRAQLDAMLDAVAAQAVPTVGHAYVFDEPRRLSRPVVLIALRGLHDGAYWTTWTQGLRERLGTARFAYADEAWLAKMARMHDLIAFLSAVNVATHLDGDERLQALQTATAESLRRMR